MLKVILTALISLGIGSIAFAQEPPAGAPAGSENAAPPAPKKEDKKMDKKMDKKGKHGKKDKDAKKAE